MTPKKTDDTPIESPRASAPPQTSRAARWETEARETFLFQCAKCHAHLRAQKCLSGLCEACFLS